MYVHTRLPRRSPLIISVLFALAAWGNCTADSQAAQPADSPAPEGPALLILEDPAEPLVPKRARTEAEEDRLEAFSLFAAARTHEQRQQYGEALRLYQRALRRDPQALTVVRSVISLAFRLKRGEQAVRYVLKAVQIEEPDPEQLQRLGAYLFQVGDFEGAARLYQKALAAGEGADQTADDVRLRMVTGRLCHATGDHDKAAEHFAHARHALEHPQEIGLEESVRKRLLGDPGQTYNLFGECFMLADRLDEAQSAFQKAHELRPNRGLLEFNLARIHARRGKPQKALAALEACFKQHLASQGMAPFMLLGEVLDEVGKKQELIERLEKLHAEDPKNVSLGYFLAEQYYQAERFQKAEPLLVSLVKKSPRPTGYGRLVEIYRKTDRHDALLAVLGEVVSKTGLLETLRGQTGTIAGDAELMQSLVETAREKHQSQPKDLNYNVRYALALLALEGKQYETAAEFFDLALEAKPDAASDVFLIWGLELLFEDRPAKAAEVFQRGIDQKALPEDDPRLHYLLAGALALDEKTDQALAAARKAVEKKQDVARFHGRVAWILYRADRHEEAIEAYRRLVAKFDADHSHSETRQVLREARLVLSNLYVVQENLSEAEEWLEQVLDEFPDNVGASNDLGYLWADQGKHLQRALKMIRHAVDAEPENVAYRDSLGWVFYRLQRYADAVAELQKAAAADDLPDPVILDHLGDAHLKAKQPQKAKRAWRRAVKAFKQREEPQKAREVQAKIKAHE